MPEQVFKALIIIAASTLFTAHSWASAKLPDSARQQQLIHLLKQDCGSCHGMTLKGGLGPALLPATLQGKPSEFLISTILLGRPGTAMPPWDAFLSRSEAHWLVLQLQQGVRNEN
jgi:cytochrome c55X